MKNQFFKTVKDLTQILGVATVSFGVIFNDLAHLDERQKKYRDRKSMEKTNWSPRSIGVVAPKQEPAVDTKIHEHAGKTGVSKK